MNMKRTIFWLRLAGASLVAWLSAFGIAQAQDYPAKTITIVVPYPAGGSSDVIARLIGQKLSESLGQAVVIDNKPGGLTIIGTQAVQRAAPDGHTLLLADNPFVINGAVMSNIPYDPLKALAPIGKVGTSPLMLLSPTNGGKKTLEELVKFAKANPGEISIANSGAGSLSHLVAEVLQRQVGTTFTHIPYRGSAPALGDAASGTVVQAAVASYASARPFVESGKLRVLAVTTASRTPAFPDVPSFEESGFKGLVIDNWWGLLAPAGTPPAVIEKLRSEIAKIITLPDMKERFSRMDVTPQMGTAAEFRATLESELKLWSRIAKEANIVID